MSDEMAKEPALIERRDHMAIALRIGRRHRVLEFSPRVCHVADVSLNATEQVSIQRPSQRAGVLQMAVNGGLDLQQLRGKSGAAVAVLSQAARMGSLEPGLQRTVQPERHKARARLQHEFGGMRVGHDGELGMCVHVVGGKSRQAHEHDGMQRPGKICVERQRHRDAGPRVDGTRHQLARETKSRLASSQSA